MCQYSSADGMANDWHSVQYAGLARGGAALVIAEATAVSPEGRLTPGDLGLWKDEQVAPIKRFVDLMKEAGAIPGIQLCHAGRKGNLNKPWEGNNPIPKGDPRHWDLIGPSPIPYVDKVFATPREMTKTDILRVKKDFVRAAERAKRAGFQWIELHFAHGFLPTSFFSSHSNQRQDEYGGNLENRCRFLVELVREVREVWPHVLTAKIGALDFDGNDEKTFPEVVVLSNKLKEAGLDSVDVSIGFSSVETKVTWKPNLMVETAAILRKEVNLPTSASWLISDPLEADEMIKRGDLDFIMLARPMLQNNHWPYLAAKKLKIEKAAWVLPAPYAYWLETYTID